MDLTDSYKNAIEDKRHDVRNIKRKAEVWDKLTDTFNMNVSVTKRPSEQLKHLWSDVNGNAQDGARYKLQLFCTGGGPALEPVDISHKKSWICCRSSLSVPGLQNDDMQPVLQYI